MAIKFKAVLIAMIAMIGLVSVPAVAYDWGVKEVSSLKSSPVDSACERETGLVCVFREEQVTFKELRRGFSDTESFAWFIKKNNLPITTTPYSLADSNKLYAVGYSKATSLATIN